MVKLKNIYLSLRKHGRYLRALLAFADKGEGRVNYYYNSAYVMASMLVSRILRIVTE